MTPDEPRAPMGGDDRDEVTPPYARLLEKLSVEHHFDFRQYKVGSLVRRIQTRLSQLHIDDVEAYMVRLDRHPEEAQALFNTILINVTSFFRDEEVWATLRDEIIPALMAARTGGPIRVWSAG